MNKQKLLLDILNILNSCDEKVDVIKKIIFEIKKSTNFESVGIRISEKEDYPYYATFGFSEDFVKLENYLCARDINNELVRDDDGNPVLECMCGNIICGRTNPKLAFFTGYGSFWSNCTTELLASSTENERQARTRNRCNGEGYESVALIPLKSGDAVHGLLQLNDREKNKFTKKDILFFEKLGECIGIALNKKKYREEIIELNKSLESKIEERTLELKTLVEFKDILIREVHHRVKNNLQMILSFIYLEIYKDTGRNKKEILTGLLNRIRAIGIIYEILLQYKNFNEIPITEHLLKLTASIKELSSDGQTKIEFVTDISEMILNIDLAIPLGIILNEIIINSIRHAFTNMNEGKIFINFNFNDDYYFFRIWDNGTGIKKDINELKKSSFGMNLIFNLCRQINAEITTDNNPGLEYSIKIKR